MDLTLMDKNHQEELEIINRYGRRGKVSALAGVVLMLSTVSMGTNVALKNPYLGSSEEIRSELIGVENDMDSIRSLLNVTSSQQYSSEDLASEADLRTGELRKKYSSLEKKSEELRSDPKYAKWEEYNQKNFWFMPYGAIGAGILGFSAIAFYLTAIVFSGPALVGGLVNLFSHDEKKPV